MDAMIRYEWPGNVRELINSVERGVILARSDFLSLEDLPFVNQKGEGSSYQDMDQNTVEIHSNADIPLSRLKDRLF